MGLSDLTAADKKVYEYLKNNDFVVNKSEKIIIQY